MQSCLSTGNFVRIQIMVSQMHHAYHSQAPRYIQILFWPKVVLKKIYQSYTTHIPVNNQGNTAYFLISQVIFTTSISWLEKVCGTIHVICTIGSLCWSTDSDWPRKIETQSQNLHGYQVNYKFCFMWHPETTYQGLWLSFFLITDTVSHYS